MTLGSLFDGIGGWQLAAVRSNVFPVWSAEIEKFPLAVTKYHFPKTQQLGDVTEIDGANITPVDIICAGSPCQDLSVAGKERKGLNGEKSGLFSCAVDIIRRMRFATGGNFPKFFIWENVTGSLSSNRGLDFRTVLEEILETKIPMPKSKWANAGMVDGRFCQLAWRVIDAQYWGIPQRRKRIFLVADFTDRRAAQILFECQSLSRNFAKSHCKECATSNTTGKCFEESNCLFDLTHADEVVRTVKGDKSNTLNARMGTGGNQVPVLIYGIGRDAFNQGANGKFALSFSENIQPPLTACGAGAICTDTVVRRLTPLECERLMGLPDFWTLVDDKSCSDAARYKALGNGMAQPVADWIISKIMEAVKCTLSKTDTAELGLLPQVFSATSKSESANLAKNISTTTTNF